MVGCDGFHGVTRAAIPVGVQRTHDRMYPYSWLGILADVPPSCDELIYAHSARGFALHSMRSPEVSRLYLQVPNGSDPADWSVERIWDELDARFAVEGDWKLRRGPITSKSVLPMRSSVTEPMRYGRVFLAGDAAHIVPPTGAKGLNLAAADVVVLARALVRQHETGSADPLDAYSDTCLRRVWSGRALLVLPDHHAPCRSGSEQLRHQAADLAAGQDRHLAVRRGGARAELRRSATAVGLLVRNPARIVAPAGRRYRGPGAGPRSAGQVGLSTALSWSGAISGTIGEDRRAGLPS